MEYGGKPPFLHKNTVFFFKSHQPISDNFIVFQIAFRAQLALDRSGLIQTEDYSHG